MLNQKDTSLITGDGRILNIKEISDIYRNGVNLAIPSSGKIQKLDENNYSITCRFKTIDCDTLDSITTSKAYALRTATRNNETEHCIETVRCVTEHQAVSEYVVTSNNGRYLARIRSPTKDTRNGGDPSKACQLLEIWERSRLLKTIDFAECDAHGPICLDVQFASMSWYPFGDQDKLIYVCQKKRSNYQSFFKQDVGSGENEKGQDRSPSSKGGKLLNFGDDYVRQEDWGECLDGVHHTIIACLDVANDCKITTLDIDGCSLAATQWLSDFKTVSVAYPEEPRRVGLVYCNSRRSHLVVHDWSQTKPIEMFTMKSNTHCYHTPRVDHSGRRFLYLKNEVWGAHRHSVRLHIHDMNTNQDLELVDKLSGEVDIFDRGLLRTCFSEDDQHIILVKSSDLYNNLCLYSLAESSFTKIKFPTTGLSLLDFKHNIILASGSEINATPTLFVAVLNPVDAGELVAWHQIEDCVHLEEIDYETFDIPRPNGGTSFIRAILTTPNIDVIQRNSAGPNTNIAPVGSLELPTIVWVHGGPNSQFVVEYMPQLAFYARLGLRALLINYLGSTGESEDYVKGLVGRMGQEDVNDCMEAIRHLVKCKRINPKKLIINGGSHGGFLSCHMSCQDEFKFTSAIIRNPVVDVSTMHTTTDIPDWCYTFALGHECYDPNWLPNSKELGQMFECSPMSKHKQANVPTLMLLGAKDRRVPPFQGARWHELLKSRGVKTKCKVYEDKHALDKPEVMADSLITSCIWILSNL